MCGETLSIRLLRHLVTPPLYTAVIYTHSPGGYTIMGDNRKCQICQLADNYCLMLF